MKYGLIIPCYNEEKYIGALLDSLFKSIEVCRSPNNVYCYVCDNGSTDNTVDIIKKYQKKNINFNLLIELENGFGLAMAKAAALAFQTVDWIISIDADCIVKIDFIDKWVSEIESSKYKILTGYFSFPNKFHREFPNASKLLFQDNLFFNQKIKTIFGIINICGANHAISKDFYHLTGGYFQPFIVEDGISKPIAGNDWDVGVKSRILGETIGFVNVGIETSDRRATIDIRSFITGEAYEGVFVNYRDRIVNADIQLDEMKELTFINNLRIVKHYVMKAILADKKLLNSQSVINLLEPGLVNDMKTWIGSNEIRDIFKERNEFIYGTLEDFHAVFGLSVYKKLKA